jgi:hypothetical protein
MRRIDRTDVLNALRDALETSVGYLSGGTVANAYDYPATCAAVAAVRASDGTVAIKTGSHNAHRESSPVTWFGPRSSRTAHLLEWAARQNAETLKQGNWIVLSSAEVTALLESVTVTSPEIEAETGAPKN